MIRCVTLAATALLGLLPPPVAAQQTDTATHKTDSAPPRRGVRIFAYPYVFYSPEANFAFGVGGILYFRAGSDTVLRPSKVLLSAYYTANQQYKITASHKLFLDANRTAGSIDLSFGEFIDKFYGTGGEAPDTGHPAYLLQLASAEASLTTRVSAGTNLKAGAILRAEHQANIEKRENSFLVTNAVTGSDGGWVTGVGADLIWDTRNNVFYPTRGIFSEARTVLYGTLLGDFGYTEAVADLRWYFTVGGRHVLGVQAYGAAVRGNVPYFKLPKLGGGSRMRGFYEGRYRDRTYVTGQVEYRTYVRRRIGLVAFASAGEVAPGFRDFRLRNFKPAGGFGLRYLFDPKERINIRADFGFGKNTSGVYFAIEEAF